MKQNEDAQGQHLQYPASCTLSMALYYQKSRKRLCMYTHEEYNRKKVKITLGIIAKIFNLCTLVSLVTKKIRR